MIFIIINNNRNSSIEWHFPDALIEELWTEVRDIVRETGIKTIPTEKKCKKAKVVWGGLTNSCEKKRGKKQGRKGKIYPFECRVPKNSKGEIRKPSSVINAKKYRDGFKKIRDTKGTFHAKMGLIKDRNGRNLTEAEDIKRDGKNIHKNYTEKIFTTQIIMMVWALT